MKKFVRFEIITADRIGITVEILEKIVQFKINLTSVEVFSKKICIKTEFMDQSKKEEIKNELYKIKDVVSVNEKDLLYYEQSDRRLRAIIDSVDDGIIAIDKNFNIEIFNNYCEGVFHYKKEEVIGTDIRKLTGENAPIVNLIKKGDKYNNIEFKIANERGGSHYITTGRAIKDDNNKTIGAVASIKDIHKAMELVDIFSSTQEVAFKEIVGNSSLIERVKKMASTVAKSNSTILLRGESGTGKELFARAVQNLSERKSNKFVTINCAALPDGLMESELFGYEKGSFTGAIHSGKEGLFKEADGGTLFLDEIGELSMFLQAKLLRVLQEGVIRKIGSNKEDKVDVRIIGATNKNLEKMIKNAEFREDLYYRLNVIPIYIPSLRERIEDIPILVSFFINKLNKKLNKKIKGAELEFINKLMEYNWPGNIRELQNVIERAMNLCEGKSLTTENLMIDVSVTYQSFVQKVDVKEEKQLKLREVLDQYEKAEIIKVLGQNKSFRKTAKILGVSHTTIINKIKKYNITF